LLVHVKGDIPAQLLADRRLNFQRVPAELFDREMDARKSEVALLDISDLEPLRLSGSDDIGISYYCENRTPFDGRQGRGGIAIEREAHAILVTLDGAYDE
jgi:hypothetical protein